MRKIQQVIEDELPGIYTYSIMLGNNESEDEKLGYFGNVNDEVRVIYLHFFKPFLLKILILKLVVFCGGFRWNKFVKF